MIASKDYNKINAHNASKGSRAIDGMIEVAPIAQIAPIVNGLTDFRINGLTNGMVE